MKLKKNQDGFIQVVIVVILAIIVLAIAIPNIFNSCRGPGDGSGSNDQRQYSPTTSSDEPVLMEEQTESYFVIKIVGDRVYVDGVEQSDYKDSIENISTAKEVAIHFSGDAKAYLVDKVVFLVKEKDLIIAEKKGV